MQNLGGKQSVISGNWKTEKGRLKLCDDHGRNEDHTFHDFGRRSLTFSYFWFFAELQVVIVSLSFEPLYIPAKRSDVLRMLMDDPEFWVKVHPLW